MISWLAGNLGTILVAAALAVVVVLIVADGIKKKKQGISACPGNCGQCPMCGSCHGTADSR